MPCDYSLYPSDWKTVIRPRILARATWGDIIVPRCEWCGAVNYESHPDTGSKVVLTVAHIDHGLENNDDENLAALCQRCHLEHDRGYHSENRKKEMRSE